MSRVNARNYPEVYKNLGVDTTKLGFVGLKVEPFEVVRFVENGESDLFFSTHPELKYAQGAVAEEKAHVTLLYGLLERSNAYQEAARTVLEGWSPPDIEIANVGVFPGSVEGEDYAVIIGHVRIGDTLQEGHDRLSFLPHIDTFPGYQAHLTLAYVKDTPGTVEKWVRSLHQEVSGRKLPVIGIDYGDN